MLSCVFCVSEGPCYATLRVNLSVPNAQLGFGKLPASALASVAMCRFVLLPVFHNSLRVVAVRYASNIMLLVMSCSCCCALLTGVSALSLQDLITRSAYPSISVHSNNDSNIHLYNGSYIGWPPVLSTLPLWTLFDKDSNTSLLATSNVSILVTRPPRCHRKLYCFMLYIMTAAHSAV